MKVIISVKRFVHLTLIFRDDEISYIIVIYLANTKAELQSNQNPLKQLNVLPTKIKAVVRRMAALVKVPVQTLLTLKSAYEYVLACSIYPSRFTKNNNISYPKTITKFPLTMDIRIKCIGFIVCFKALDWAPLTLQTCFVYILHLDL